MGTKPPLTSSDDLACATPHGLGASSRFGGVEDWEYTPSQLFAIGEHDFNDAPDSPAVLDRYHSDRNLIPNLHGLLAPAVVNHGGRIFSLRSPLRHLAVVIWYVELKDAMGIGPNPLCNGPLDRNVFPRVISCVAVVCEQRKGKDRNTNT